MTGPKPRLVCAEFRDGERVSPWRDPDQANAWARRAEGMGVRAWLRSIVPGVTQVGWKEITKDDVFIDVDRASAECQRLMRIEAEREFRERYMVRRRVRVAPVITRDGAIIDEAVAWYEENPAPTGELALRA